MESNYVLVIFWFFFACLTFGCLVGGNEPKIWKQPTKGEAFKIWLLSVFWPVTYIWWFVSEFELSWFLGEKK